MNVKVKVVEVVPFCYFIITMKKKVIQTFFLVDFKDF